MEYESGGREALLSFWLECDKGEGPILFPPDATQRSLPPHLFRAYRRLWLSYEGGTVLLGQLLKKGWRKTPRLWRMILSAAYAELIWSEPTQYFAIVHSWVEIAKKKSNKVAVAVVNGSLRNVCRQLESGTWTFEKTLPQGLLEAWSKSGGDSKYLKTILDEQRRQFWFPQQIALEQSPADGAEKVSFGNLWGWKLPLGIFPDRFLLEQGGFMQNLSAAELCHTVFEDFQQRGGRRFLDLCAAPGGKTWQLARLGVKELEYHDENPKRLQEMEQSKGANFFPQAKKAREQSFESANYDGVLLDVPCSNSGVLSKCPEAIRHYWKSGDDFLAVQEEALLKGISLLKPDGALYYSTCSIDPVENQLRIRKFGEKYDLKLVSEKIWLPDLVGRHGAYLAILVQCE
jgi:16S rRNA (cytosine967-C5)-methyltransferase